MPLDGITINCLALELNQALAGARLDRIYQPDRYDIFLTFRRVNENLRLILSANPASPRVHLTRENRDNPANPPMFCMLLRKHLIGSRLLEVRTPGFERILQFKFATINELGDQLEKTLIAEIMGRHSNIILLNQDQRIHDAILHVDHSISRVREVMPARIYQLPPDQKKLSPDEASMRLARKEVWMPPAMNMQPLEKVLLAALQGFSPQLCQDVLDAAGLDPRLKPALMTPADTQALTEALQARLTEILTGQYRPSTFYDAPDAGIPIDFHALPLRQYRWQKIADSVSHAMDLFYLERSRQNTLRQKKQFLEKALNDQLEHARKKLSIHQSDIEESQNREQYRLFGELILANMHLEEPKHSLLPAVNYYDEAQSIVEIPLDPGLSLAGNAQRYFKRYAKARARFENSSRLAQEDQKDIKWLETLLNALAAATHPDDLTAVREEMLTCGLPTRKIQQEKKATTDSSTATDMQPGRPVSQARLQKLLNRNRRQPQNKRKNNKPAALPPRQYTSSDGLTILVGRNNLQNDHLTMKVAQKDDIWLHVQKLPGTHVIIRANHQSVPEQTLLEAAAIAAWFSKAAASFPQYRQETAPTGNFQKVAVDYCPVGHVRKPAGSRPGMVVYDQYKTIMVTPQEPPDPI
ncbi:MAG: fibronectin/fibrinogen-binding protein [Clostridiaceae bacterium]|nr:fibronectin/fibrinogen-binding protein [Clostridiaceae bacterium]